jgi:hypothetical protein
MAGGPKTQIGPPSRGRIRGDALGCLTERERNALILAARGAPSRAIGLALGWRNVTRNIRYADRDVEVRAAPWVEPAVERTLAEIRQRVERRAAELAALERKEPEMAEEKQEVKVPEDRRWSAAIAEGLRASLRNVEEEIERVTMALLAEKKRLTAALEALGAEEPEEETPDPAEKLDEKEDAEDPKPDEAPLREKETEGKARRRGITPEALRDIVVREFKDGREFTAGDLRVAVGVGETPGDKERVRKPLAKLVKAGIVTQTGNRAATRYRYSRRVPDPAQKHNGNGSGRPDRVPGVTGASAPARGRPVAGTGSHRISGVPR